MLKGESVKFGQGEKIVPLLNAALTQRQLRRHVDRLEVGLRLVLRRTDLHTERAPRTVFDRNGDVEELIIVKLV